MHYSPYSFITEPDNLKFKMKLKSAQSYKAQTTYLKMQFTANFINPIKQYLLFLSTPLKLLSTNPALWILLN